MSNWARQFSMPCTDGDPAVFDAIVLAHGVGVAGCLLERHAANIANASHGLVSFIRAWIERPGIAEAAWDLAFGRAHLALKEGKVDATDAAVRMGLQIANYGQPGHWSAQVSPTPILVDDRVVEQVEHVEVEAVPGQATCLRLRSSSSDVTLWRNVTDRRWTGHGGKPIASAEDGEGRSIYLLPRMALPSEDGGGEIFRECQPVEFVTAEMVTSFRDGLTVVRQNAPEYVPWIERVLRGIVVCPRQVEYRLVSGSWEDVPGLVHMSSPHGGIDIAEILVHECAHQYFYMLQRVGPVDDGRDGTLYWSPPIRKKRPLSRILMAYHALANVQLLYRAVRQNSASDEWTVGYVRANEPELQAAIRALEEPLRGNSALTALGRALYEPLADRLELCRRFEGTSV